MGLQDLGAGPGGPSVQRNGDKFHEYRPIPFAIKRYGIGDFGVVLGRGVGVGAPIFT